MAEMKFAGKITTYEKKTDDENQSEDVVMEVTEAFPDSTVEISFDDRNERCYLRLKLTDLIAAVALFNASAT